MDALLIFAVADVAAVPDDDEGLDAALRTAHDAGGLLTFPLRPDPLLLLGDALAAMDAPLAAFPARAPGKTRALSVEDLTAIFASAPASAYGQVRRIAAGDTESPLLTLDQSLEIMRIMDEVRAQIGVVYPNEK